MPVETVNLQFDVHHPEAAVPPGGPAPTQRGVDAVSDLGMSSDGSSDCAGALQAFFDGSKYPAEVHFKPGKYRFDATVETNGNLIKLVGDGHISNIGSTGAVTFFTDKPLTSMLWFNCPVAASNLQSVWIEHIQFTDTSAGHNALKSAVRITNQANFVLLDVGAKNLIPRRYTTGTVSVTKGSKTVTGTGTNWSPDLLPGFLNVAGYPYEIASINNSGSLTLALMYQGASNSNLTYAISTGGIFLWLDPGLGFTQYGQVLLKSHSVGYPVYMSYGAGATGTSRIKFRGYINGGSIPDGIGAYMGPFSDTMEWRVACNSFAFGTVIANGHQNDIGGADYENAGTPPPVTGSSAQGYAAPKGVLIMGDSASNTWGNRIVNSYFRQVGTAIELCGIPTQTKIGFNTFRSNPVIFEGGNATKTVGEIDGAFYGTAFNVGSAQHVDKSDDDCDDDFWGRKSDDDWDDDQ